MLAELIPEAGFDRGGLRHANSLTNDRPDCGLIRGVEQDRSQSGEPLLQRPDDAAALAERGETAPVDVQAEHLLEISGGPAGQRGGWPTDELGVDRLVVLAHRDLHGAPIPVDRPCVAQRLRWSFGLGAGETLDERGRCAQRERAARMQGDSHLRAIVDRDHVPVGV